MMWRSFTQGWERERTDELSRASKLFAKAREAAKAEAERAAEAAEQEEARRELHTKLYELRAAKVRQCYVPLPAPPHADWTSPTTTTTRLWSWKQLLERQPRQPSKSEYARSIAEQWPSANWPPDGRNCQRTMQSRMHGDEPSWRQGWRPRQKQRRSVVDKQPSMPNESPSVSISTRFVCECELLC